MHLPGSLPETYSDPPVSKITKCLCGHSHMVDTMNIYPGNANFSGENSIWNMPSNILKHKELLFLALRDTVLFENQSLEIRLFPYFIGS